MNTIERLYAVSSRLPPLAQAELLDFAEFLQPKNRTAATTGATPLQALAGGL
ncbi:MAG: DUF2281 domain-containing protein, partial [Gammaproteobacteria bacterium]|nr:DUF2281 domain-containing protein [Gammaproteobacteria bacterium]